MEDKEKRVPDFVGNGIAIWKNEKNGKKFLTVQILGGLYVNCFKNNPKPKKVVDEDDF